MENNYKITKEDLKEVFKNPARIKGMALKGGTIRVIQENWGEKGLKIIEEESKKLGLPIIPRKIKETDWYPAGITLEIFYILQEKFNFQEKDFAKFGEATVKFSPTIRLLMKYFTIPEKIAKVAGPRLWRRFYDVGEVEVCQFEETKTEGFLTVRVKNFKLHPLHFLYLGHFFLGMLKLARKFKETSVEETKSPFKGDKYQEYLLKWKF